MQKYNYIIVFLIILLMVYWIIRKNNSINNHTYYHKPIIYSYRTDDGSFKIVSKNTYHPTSLKEIIKIIKDSQGRKIRVSGGDHTFNDISISPDITIRTDNLRKVLNIDKIRKQITVESGITLLELNKVLQKNGLALKILPAIPFQCIGGALSLLLPRCGRIKPRF